MKEKTPFKFCSLSKTNRKFCVSQIPSEGPTGAHQNSTNTENESECYVYSIDNALKATGQGRYHMYLLLVCGCVMMGFAVENSNIGFVMPYVRCDIDISTTEQGLLSSISYIGTIIFSIFWGLLADVSGRRRVLLISTIGTFTFSIVIAFAYNVEMLIVARLFIGIFLAGIQAATYSYIGEFHSSESRAKACSFVAVFIPAAYIFLALLAWAVIQWNWALSDFKILPWRVYLFLTSLLSGINFICLYQLPESPKFLISINRKEDALVVLRKMYSTNTALDEKLYPVRDLRSEFKTTRSDVHGVYDVLKLMRNQTLPLFKPPNSRIFFKLSYVSFSLSCVGSGIFVWFPYFLTLMQEHKSNVLCDIVTSNADKNATFKAYIHSDSWLQLDFFDDIMPMMDLNNNNSSCNNRSSTLVFKILIAMGVLYVTISSVISVFIDRVDRRLLFSLWILLCVCSSLIILYVPEFYTVSLSFIIFLSTGTCSSIIIATSVGEFPAKFRAMGTCLILCFGRFGAIVGSNIVGFFMANQCSNIFRLSAILILSCSIVCAFLKLKKSTVLSINDKCLSNSTEIKI